MKLLAGLYEGKPQVFVQKNETDAVPLKTEEKSASDMNDLIRKWTADEIIGIRDSVNAVTVPVSEIGKQPAVQVPEYVICLGENYMDHATESYRFQKVDYNGKQPNAVYFAKHVNRTTGDGLMNGHLDHTEKLDYECELAVIIGKDAYQVSRENVRDYIFGYAVTNDFSARDLQYGHKQNFFGKSADGYFAMGSAVLTADEVEMPPRLRIRSWVNGELRQDAYTDEVFFTTDHIVSELSSIMTLKAGTVIMTGTPKGVAMGMEPPVFLKHGDIVKCEIEKIGTLQNTID